MPTRGRITGVRRVNWRFNGKLRFGKPEGTTMENMIEGVENKEMNSALGDGEDKGDEVAVSATVQVYGQGPTKNPFYEEVKALNATSKGASLILSIPVSRGQKLLLINKAGQDPAEAEVIRTRTLDAQMFEVEIAFLVPRLNFWTPSRGDAKSKSGAERRRSLRV